LLADFPNPNFGSHRRFYKTPLKGTLRQSIESSNAQMRDISTKVAHHEIKNRKGERTNARVNHLTGECSAGSTQQSETEE
jgi:hypothetical protein